MIDSLDTQKKKKVCVFLCSCFAHAMRNTRKAKAPLELNLAKDIKKNKKGFFKYMNNKRKAKDNVGLLPNGRDTLVTENAEKAELLNAAFALGQDQPSGISDLGDQGRGVLKGRFFPWSRIFGLENNQANLMFTSPWALIGFIHKC